MKPTKEFQNDLLTKIDYGIKKGAAVARMQHKLNGKPIYVFENGKLVEIPPEQIEINEPNKEF